jgi:prohibitin 2
MSQSQKEAWERLQVMLSKRKAGFGGGFPSGGGRGGLGLVGGLILAGVGTWVVSNSLFNGMLRFNTWRKHVTDDFIVDGGHRAIKYSRLGGVKKEIYAEGMKTSQLSQIALSDSLDN